MTAPPLARVEPTEIVYSHILFMDIVGYSRLQIAQQKAVVQELQELVSATQPFMRAEADGALIARPTGDGMALIFFNDGLAPLRCALEIAAAAQGRPHIPLRMGINTGPVTVVRDINGQPDVHGDGIVMAQRVMDFGDEGHILLSKSVAEMLGHALPSNWHLDHYPYCEIKHGQFIELYNLFTREYGKRKSPRKVIHKATERLEKLARPASAVLAEEVHREGKGKSALWPLLGVLFLVGFGASFWFLPPLYDALVARGAEQGEQPQPRIASLPPPQLNPGTSFPTPGQSTPGAVTPPGPAPSTEKKPARNAGKRRPPRQRPNDAASTGMQNPDMEFDRLFIAPTEAPKKGQLWRIVFHYKDSTGSHTATSGDFTPESEIPVQFKFQGDSVSVWAVISDTQSDEATRTGEQEFTQDFATREAFVLESETAPSSEPRVADTPAEPAGTDAKAQGAANAPASTGKTGDKPQSP